MRLRDFDLAVVIDDGKYTPASLARAVDDAGARAAWGRWDFDSDGAGRTAALVSRMVADGAQLRAAQAS